MSSPWSQTPAWVLVLYVDHLSSLTQVTHLYHQLNLTTYLTPATVRFLHGPALWAIVLWTPCLRLCRTTGVPPRLSRSLNPPGYWKRQSTPQEQETRVSLARGKHPYLCAYHKPPLMAAASTAPLLNPTPCGVVARGSLNKHEGQAYILYTEYANTYYFERCMGAHFLSYWTDETIYHMSFRWVRTQREVVTDMGEVVLAFWLLGETSFRKIG